MQPLAIVASQKESFICPQEETNPLKARYFQNSDWWEFEAHATHAQSQTLRPGFAAKDEPPSIVNRVTSCTRQFFCHPWTQAGLVTISVVGIGVCAPILSATLGNYVEACINQLNDFSSNLSACRAPYVSTIKTCEAVIGVASGILGIMAQHFFAPSATPAESPSRLDKEKQEKIEKIAGMDVAHAKLELFALV